MRMRIVVTGANRGIGLEACRQLAAEGHAVVLTSRSAEAGEAAAAKLRGKNRDVASAVLDVTSDESVRAFAEHAKKAWGTLDAIVNNAAISMRGFDENVARKTLDTNFYGPLRVIDVLSPLLRDGGNVVNVSSGMGDLSVLGAAIRREFADPALDRKKLIDLVERFVREVGEGTHQKSGWPSSAYSVSKAALNALTRIVAKEQPRIHVNSVCPGWVRTDMGGAGAPRSVEEGASGIVWAAIQGERGPTGGNFRDGAPIGW